MLTYKKVKENNSDKTIAWIEIELLLNKFIALNWEKMPHYEYNKVMWWIFRSTW